MIYVTESDKKVKLPRHYSGNDRLRMVLVQSGIEYTLCDYQEPEYSEFYIMMNISYFPTNVGEYEYKLIHEDKVIDRGLLTFGEYKKPEIKSIYSEQQNIQLK